MNTKVLGAIAIACVAALSGCAHHRHYINPERPQVLFANGYLVVNQEPIVVARKANEPAVVSWRLSAESGLTFDEDGIVIVGRIKDRDMKRVDDRSKKGITCQRGETPPAPAAAQTRGADQAANMRAFTCLITPDALPGLYMYEINARDSANKRISADPTLMI